MDGVIPEEIRKAWNEWNLRGCIILSLSLQAILVFFGFYRQRSRSSVVLTLVWVSYLMADWVAAVSIGLISQSQGDSKNCDTKSDNVELSKDLAAFWASFLLVHLGGPDSITSYSLEDNELWNRHLLGLLLQVSSAGYCFYLTSPENKLWPPTLMVSIVGTIKYVERTRALYLASLDRFGSTNLPKPDPGPDYEHAATTYTWRSLDAPTQAEMITISEDICHKGPQSNDYGGTLENEITVLCLAYKLFERFKCVIAGFYLTSVDRDLTKRIFKNTESATANRLIEYELSFMFQVFHTKANVAGTKIGCVLRSICLIFILASFVCFFMVEKYDFTKFDTALTYTLLVGAIFLDIVSIFQLVFSDWMVLVLRDRWTQVIPNFILCRSKWSKQVSQYSLVNYCVDEPSRWLFRLAGWVHASGFLNKIKIMWYSSRDILPDMDTMYYSLRNYAERASTIQQAVEISQQRGEFALSSASLWAYIKLKWSITEFQYTESLLIWHMATDICCHRKPDNSKEKRDCKILSNYMFYILIKKSGMLSPVLGNWHVVFQDTCAEAKRFFSKYSIRTRTEALEALVDVKTRLGSAALKGGNSKSVFYESCILAQQLEGLGEEQWSLMQQVWVDLMSYAAINCQPIVHAQQLSSGGELLTFTWLMMTHLGLGLQFSEQEERTETTNMVHVM